MIRSSKSSLKFSNRAKLVQLEQFITEYRSVMKQAIDLLWDLEEIPTLAPKEITNQINSWLTARAIQAACKQASAVVRGTQQKQKQRLFVINKLQSENKHNKAVKLQKIYDSIQTSKPDLGNVNPELDSRFCKIELEQINSFDGWLTLGSLGNKFKLILPFKRTKHFNQLLQSGTIKSGVRISVNSITFMFDLAESAKSEGTVLGIDIGLTNVVSCSDGISSNKNNHGYDLSEITKVLSRKRKGSKGFRKAQTHRTNYINWSINQLDLTDVKEIRIEKIRNLRSNKRSSRQMGHWTYRGIFDKIRQTCELNGVHLVEVNPTFTSQRCHNCGWTHKSNRKAKHFECVRCGYAADADMNAASNIALDLAPIYYRH